VKPSRAEWRKSSYSNGNGGHCVEVSATWRKSTYSNANGGHCVEVATAWLKSSHSHGNGGECVEVAAAWSKSSHSHGNGGACVEVAGNIPHVVAVRDSKDPEGPRLSFSRADWTAFTDGVRNGEFSRM